MSTVFNPPVYSVFKAWNEFEIGDLIEEDDGDVYIVIGTPDGPRPLILGSPEDPEAPWFTGRAPLPTRKFRLYSGRVVLT